MAESLSKVSFDKIRYANCWEDADMLLRGLKVQPGARILSVCSAGDNSFSLLCTSPEQVLATDISGPQLFLTELKASAIKNLDDEELLRFLGIKDSPSRIKIFTELRSSLSRGCVDFYEKNLATVAGGVIHSGKFENYFRIFRQYILPLVHSKKVTAELLAPKTIAEQKTFYDKSWNTWRWRMLFRVFFSRWLMGKLGRDPEFLRQVDIPVASYLFQRSEEYIGAIDLQQNPYLHYIFTGNYGQQLPHYLKKENLDLIRQNLDRLHLKQAYIQDIEDKGFTHFNLSNIFEYLDEKNFSSCAEILAKLGAREARYFYWNLMVPRSLSSSSPGLFKSDPDWKHEAREDKCFFYRSAHSDIRA